MGLLSKTPNNQTKPTLPTRKSSGRGVMAGLFARPGVGKSSAFAHFPNCRFICDSRDQGILDLLDYSANALPLSPESVRVASDYSQLIRLLNEAIDGPCQTVVTESVVGLQALCEDTCLQNDFGGNKYVFQSFQAGPSLAANVYFQGIIDLFIKGQNLGKNMFLTGHTKITTGGKNVVGEDWVSQIMDTTPDVARRIDASMANIFNIGYLVTTDKVSSKQKAETSQLQLYTTINPLFPAKNRMGVTGTYPVPDSSRGLYLLLCELMSLDPRTGVRKSNG